MTPQKKRQLIIFGSIFVVFIASVVYAIVKIRTPEKTNISSSEIPKVQGRVEDKGPGGTVQEMPETYRKKAEFFDQAKTKISLENENVKGAMKIYSPTEEATNEPAPIPLPVPSEYIGSVTPINPNSTSVATPAQETVPVDTKPQKPPKYKYEQYAAVYGLQTNLLSAWGTKSNSGPRPDAPVKVLSVEQANSLAFQGLDQPRLGYSPTTEALKVQQQRNIALGQQNLSGAQNSTLSSGAGVGQSVGASNPQNQQIEISTKNARSVYPVRAGDIFYGHFINEVNSSSNAPILVKVTSGPLKDNVLIGQVQMINKMAQIQFNLVDTPGGTLAINAAAVEPSKVSILQNANYDGRYWERFGLPALAGFVGGVGTGLRGEVNRTSCNGTFRVDPITGATICVGEQKRVYGLGQQVLINGTAGTIDILRDEVNRERQNAIPFVTIPAGESVAVIAFSSVASNGTFRAEGTGSNLNDRSNLSSMLVNGSPVSVNSNNRIPAGIFE